MENRHIVDTINKYIVKGVKNNYAGYKIENRTLKAHNYIIETPFICIIASTALHNASIVSLDYLYINIFNNLNELLSIDITVIQNPYFIFIPSKEVSSELELAVEDIKRNHSKHGFIEEPFYNSL